MSNIVLIAGLNEIDAEIVSLDAVNHGLQAAITSDFATARRFTEERPTSLLLTVLGESLEGGSWSELCHCVRVLAPKACIVCLSASQDYEQRTKSALLAGADDCFACEKPIIHVLMRLSALTLGAAKSRDAVLAVGPVSEQLIPRPNGEDRGA